ncbi:MAG: 3-oxoacid CoA-transferase subunit B [Deinococcales bacterium]
MDARELIARRAALLLEDGELVALGIGLPTLVGNHIPPERRVVLFAEDGIAGIGPRPAQGEEDVDLINAGGEPISRVPETAVFDSALAFALVRGGRLGTAVLGTMQVSDRGDIASWKAPGGPSPGMGGSMELAAKARRTLVLTRHRTRAGEPKIVERCDLPLTAPRAASVIVTELGLFQVTPQGLVLRERARAVSVDDVRAVTPCRVETDGPVVVMEDVLERGVGGTTDGRAEGGRV